VGTLCKLYNYLIMLWRENEKRLANPYNHDDVVVAAAGVVIGWS